MLCAKRDYLLCAKRDYLLCAKRDYLLCAKLLLLQWLAAVRYPIGEPARLGARPHGSASRCVGDQVCGPMHQVSPCVMLTWRDAWMGGALSLVRVRWDEQER